VDKLRVYPASGGRSFAFRVRSAVHKLTHALTRVVAIFAAIEMAAGFPGRPPKRAPHVILCPIFRPIPAVGPAYLLYRGNVAEKSDRKNHTTTDFSQARTVRWSFWRYGAFYLFSRSYKMACVRRSCLILSVCDANPGGMDTTRGTCQAAVGRRPRNQAILMGSAFHTKDRYLHLLWSTHRQNKTLQPRAPRDIATATSSREHSPDIRTQRPIGNCRHASATYVPPSRSRRPLTTIDQIC